MNIKRAGDVKGTPDWQLDRMIEMDMAMSWEEQNRETQGERNIRAALPDLMIADETLRGAVGAMSCAYLCIENMPEGDKLGSIMDAIEDAVCDLKALIDTCEGRKTGE